MKGFLSVAALAATLAVGPGVAGNTIDTHPALGPLEYRSRVVDGHQLLAYDPKGDGRVVEVLGDLATADHIAVVVPGSGHRLGNFWTSTSAAAPRRNGVALLRELRRQAPHRRVAVVVWMGYDAPERIDVVAARSDRAAAGGRDLARFTHLLPSRATITLIGHSYGTVVLGRAAPQARADHLIALGSPGMDVDSAAELRTTARVWAARAADDPIRMVPAVRVNGIGHGTSPVARKFGANSFSTGSIRGHDRYFQPGSESLVNIARIVMDQPGDVTPVRTNSGDLS
ncbi:alpha/beta hydrolase [Actinopolymorpha alba]|uniref:alpha/beta hydrolase n=1 Tax=Actinopolymorpha alba TaxID=533267 RepID=UPI000374E0B0|nr:alpha/beta hydrolase [Actinopolymorpha alba]